MHAAGWRAEGQPISWYLLSSAVSPAPEGTAEVFLRQTISVSQT